MKKEYLKPSMKVVELQRQNLLLVGSDRSVNSLSNDSPFSWDGDGFDADDKDY